MGGIVVALTIGFLLGILLMVLLVGGQEEERLVERVEQVGASRRPSAHGSDQPTESVKQARSVAD